jgi:hypothetical protein
MVRSLRAVRIIVRTAIAVVDAVGAAGRSQRLRRQFESGFVMQRLAMFKESESVFRKLYLCGDRKRPRMHRVAGVPPVK